MLFSNVYNHGMTDKLRSAYATRDIEFFHHQIQAQATRAMSLDPASPEYTVELSKLMIVLALHDSLTTQGETVSFIMDYINL